MMERSVVPWCLVGKLESLCVGGEYIVDDEDTWITLKYNK